ncbi:MAP kinase phosphatase with leucine-rich repeats protein 1-like [Planoprotostelium fungivorum]|uniref:MAP kinase phosphatase with leucine-rich repeats protein 1-like n=1 Tax=Planoprotostelium fungivorum TaxID=1890364 RepID=A0A2P6NQB1_9EUKA|nr:MAP kinase phosphatase with leucine-rich repeats protein 1-like [Planoprotostelium fungivorum]
MSYVKSASAFLTDMDEIIPNLYLGNMRAAQTKAFLDKYMITHILTAATSISPEYPEDYIYKVVHLYDQEEQDLFECLEDSFRFIDEALRGAGTILVHCAAGVSRSASIVIGYLMWSRKKSFLEAFTFVRSKRPIIGPNDGFMWQLQLYEKMGLKIDPNHEEYRLWMNHRDDVVKQFFIS